MKQEDKQYEKWLTEVKSNQPILENPEELTATILNRISGISPERKRRKFLIGAWASGIAASLLLLLFINDTCFTSVPHRTEMQNEYDNWSNSIPLPVTPVTTVCVRYAILRWIMNPPFPIR